MAQRKAGRQPGARPGCWTPEAEAELLALYETHGAAWAAHMDEAPSLSDRTNLALVAKLQILRHGKPERISREDPDAPPWPVPAAPWPAEGDYFRGRDDARAERDVGSVPARPAVAELYGFSMLRPAL